MLPGFVSWHLSEKKPCVSLKRFQPTKHLRPKRYFLFSHLEEENPFLGTPKSSGPNASTGCQQGTAGLQTPNVFVSSYTFQGNGPLTLLFLICRPQPPATASHLLPRRQGWFSSTATGHLRPERFFLCGYRWTFSLWLPSGDPANHQSLVQCHPRQ